VTAQRPLVSVVVATYGRAHLLPRLVAALERQTVPADRIELVLVDDASPDETPTVTARLAAATPLQMTVRRMERNGGPARARNAGWATTGCDVVAFTDDDCVPTPGWLESGLAAARDHDVVAGRTMPNPEQLQHLGAFSRTIRSEDARFVQTCNAFYRRTVLDSLNGFDEALRTGEDTDLALRATEHGCSLGFAADALVHHDVRPPSLRSTVRETLLWADLPGVVRRHPQVRSTHLRHGLWWKRSHPPALFAVGGIAAAAATRRWTPLLATLPWLRHRLHVEPLTEDRRQRIATLPGAFAVDTLEVAVMVRGSIKHRTMVL
jgi:hypothetical protein